MRAWDAGVRREWASDEDCAPIEVADTPVSASPEICENDYTVAAPSSRRYALDPPSNGAEWYSRFVEVWVWRGFTLLLGPES